MNVNSTHFFLRRPHVAANAALVWRHLAIVMLLTLLWMGGSQAVSAQTLFGATSSGPSSLYHIDPATGAATLVGPIGFDFVSAMDFHPVTGVLYGIGSRPGATNPISGTSVLITIDPVTGAGTEVGPTGLRGSRIAS